MVDSDKTGSYYKLLAEEAAKGDEEAGRYLRDAFALAVSLQNLKKADEIARESGMTEEKQSEYVRSALKPMNDMPDMESH
ncbi:MAG: hypothetical protein U9Q92_03085, partial [archaeon]|nr:hypothetical protein [archaeon]